MKEYEIALTITDATSVDAETKAEALEIAKDIFKENGYGLDCGYHMEIIKERKMEQYNENR